ncbi:adenylate/guanylate cyclase domain-containing protein [Variovorax sp. OV329]|uniref:adenylate/guanylate cyclase domain-containing protein n=1 Tax=Variovorax sp. OV329 TaxID=1882825 RepID=UPI0008F2FB07|nr:adenylate/guanylate cyclase domain-containing protein [Variovorax sp. OV329]SFM87677.1 adenylate cyclase [Variovorax sp. OV329]
MQCSACNSNNPDTNRFCESCGCQFGSLCSHCGRENGPTARFCGACGTGLAPAAVAAALEVVAPTRLTEHRGELKIATVLFADIASSTEAVAHLGPEDAMQRLQPAVHQMCEAVERYGGTVVRTLGDGLLALFGAPRTLEGHVRLACEAALRIQAVFANDASGLSVRIGLHTGQIASDPTVGISARSDGVHGLTIHLASRVMASAEPGEIRITQATRAQAGDHYDCDALGLVPLKGIGTPTSLFSLARSNAVAEGLLRRNTRAQFRGRTVETALLQSAIEQAEKGAAPVIGISGEPGAGKSRLCSEFAAWCRARGVVVHEVRVQLYGHAAPLQPILELFRKCFFQISDIDDAATARRKLSQALSAQHAGDLQMDAQDEALVAEFIGLTNSDDAPPMSSSMARRSRLLAITRQLVRQPREQVTLILLEDLHWLDEPSLEFLSELVTAVVGTKVLLLLNHRPVFTAAWQAGPNYRRLDLNDLSNEIVGQIVGDLTSYHRNLSAARELIIRRSGGNPLFAEELVRSLNEDVISFVASSVEGKIDALERSLPFNVQSIIGARIDRLSPADKSLLQMCSVIGKDIPLFVLERIAREEVSGDIGEILERLCAADFIQLQPDEAGFEYSFRHPLIQEVAYETQLRARRSSLHEAVAGAMEEYYRSRAKEFAALIAHHYAAAGAHLKAAQHEAKAAAWIASTNASQATKHWRKVRELLKNQPATQEVGSLRSHAGGRIVLLGWREGLRQEEIQQIVEESLALAEQTDVNLVQLLLFAQGRSLQSNGGASDEYVQCVRKALALAPHSTGAGRRALLDISLSHAYAWSGLLREGIAANDAGLAGQAQIDTFDREFIGVDADQWGCGIRARLLNRLGRFDEALQLLAQLAGRAASDADPVMRQIAHHVHIDLAWCSDDKELVADHSEQVMKFAATSSSSYAQIFAHNCAGIAASVLGDFAQARTSFNEALARLKESRAAVEFGPEILAGLAESCLGQDAHDCAISYAESAITAATLQSNRIAECRSLIVLGSALLRSRQAERVPLLLERARDLVNVTGATILQKKLDLALQELPDGTSFEMAPSARVAHQ